MSQKNKLKINVNLKLLSGINLNHYEPCSVTRLSFISYQAIAEIALRTIIGITDDHYFQVAFSSLHSLTLTSQLKVACISD